MNVAVYVRVSTEGQEPENQLIQLRDYCTKSNWTVFDEYMDIISGKEESRPQYDRLFQDAHKKLFDVVIFWALDRFARSGTLFTLQKLKELENLGINWHSYQEPYISSIGPWKDVVISIFATIAKLERERISERTKLAFVEREGITIARKSGKKVGRPEIPLETIAEVELLLLSPNPPSYRQISRIITYKGFHGKTRNVSTAIICSINQRLEMEGRKKDNTVIYQ